MQQFGYMKVAFCWPWSSVRPEIRWVANYSQYYISFVVDDRSRNTHCDIQGLGLARTCSCRKKKIVLQENDKELHYWISNPPENERRFWIKKINDEGISLGTRFSRIFLHSIFLLLAYLKETIFLQGYMKRQALYACVTCCPADSGRLAGVCLACSYHCHEDHDLVELYTKRQVSISQLNCICTVR